MNDGRIQMRAILQTLPGLIGELRGPEAREAIVFAIWPSIVGEQLREISATVRLEDQTLVVAVPGIEWKREFQQHAGSIVYKLNAALKNSVVDRLEFVIDTARVRNSVAKSAGQSGLPQNIVSKDISVAASQITDPELRKNFLKAAAACMVRRDAAIE